MRSLVRRAALGLRFEPSLDPQGVRVTAVLEGTGAHHAGMRVGDVIIAADQETIRDGSALRAWAATLRAFDKVTLWVLRESPRPMPIKVTVYARATEQHAEVEHQYDQHALADGTLLRVIRSRAKDQREPRACVFALPGYRRDSCEFPTLPDYPMRRWVEDVARAGIDVVRVERRGLGDSEGEGDSQGFLEERDDLCAAVKRFCAERIGRARPVIYGYSLSGLYAPHVAAQCDARAIAVFGSGIDTWTEYLDALLRRRLRMERADEAAIERAVRAQQALYATVHIRGETVAQAVARRPWIEEFRSMLAFDVERNAIDGRPARFWREVYEQRTADELAACPRPLLALWGEQDWLTTRDEHQRIASACPRGTFVSLPRTDHGYAAHDSPLSSLRGHAAPYSPNAARALIAWIDAID